MAKYTHLEAVEQALGDWRPAMVGGMYDLAADILRARVVWICGNGGSQAVAEHWVTDWTKARPEGIYIAPASNAALYTMATNDHDPAHWFGSLLGGRTEEDLVICISTSGDSPNLLVAPEWAITPSPSALSHDAHRIISGPKKPHITYTPAELEDVYAVLGHAITEILRDE